MWKLEDSRAGCNPRSPVQNENAEPLIQKVGKRFFRGLLACHISYWYLVCCSLNHRNTGGASAHPYRCLGAPPQQSGRGACAGHRQDCGKPKNPNGRMWDQALDVCSTALTKLNFTDKSINNFKSLMKAHLIQAHFWTLSKRRHCPDGAHALNYWFCTQFIATHDFYLD